MSSLTGCATRPTPNARAAATPDTTGRAATSSTWWSRWTGCAPCWRNGTAAMARSLWTLGGAVAGAFFGYATCDQRDNYWTALVYISITALCGAGMGWGWSGAGRGGGASDDGD